MIRGRDGDELDVVRLTISPHPVPKPMIPAVNWDQCKHRGRIKDDSLTEAVDFVDEGLGSREQETSSFGGVPGCLFASAKSYNCPCP